MRIWIGIIVIQSVIVVSAEFAAAGGIDKKAKAAYEEGKAHFEAGRFKEALAAFTDAYNRTAEPKLLFNLGAAAEGLGDRERAKAYYQVYLEELPDAEDADEVRARIEKLSKEPVAASPEPAVEEPAPTQPPVTSSTENIDPRKYYQINKEKKKHMPMWPILSMGLGGMVLAGGMITAILAKTKYNDLASTCKPNCTDDQISTSKALAVVSDVQFVIGGIAATTGIISFVLLKKKYKESKSAMQMVPYAMPGGGGMAVEGRF